MEKWEECEEVKRIMNGERNNERWNEEEAKWK